MLWAQHDAPYERETWAKLHVLLKNRDRLFAMLEVSFDALRADPAFQQYPATILDISNS